MHQSHNRSTSKHALLKSSCTWSCVWLEYNFKESTFTDYSISETSFHEYASCHNTVWGMVCKLFYTETLGEDQTHDVHDILTDTHVHAAVGLFNLDPMAWHTVCHIFIMWYEYNTDSEVSFQGVNVTASIQIMEIMSWVSAHACWPKSWCMF